MRRAWGQAPAGQPDERHASTGPPLESLEGAQGKVSDVGVVPSGRSRVDVARARFELVR